MVKHKLTQLKQLELTMHEYFTKFRDMVEHAYSIKPTNSASIILASNFIEGVQNPHIKNMLRSYQVKNVKDIFSHAIQEAQKQKIRALDFEVSPKQDPILNCTASFKCGSEDYFIKDCLLSWRDNMAQKGNYTDHRHVNKSDSKTDMVMEPLTRLFTNLAAQSKLLTRSGHSSHNGPPILKVMVGLVKGGWVFTMAIASMVMAITINEMNPIRIAAWTITIRHLLDTMVTNRAVGVVQVTRTVLPKDLTPGFTRLSPVVSVTQSDQLHLTLRSTWRKKLSLHQSHQKTKLPLSSH